MASRKEKSKRSGGDLSNPEGMARLEESDSTSNLLGLQSKTLLYAGCSAVFPCLFYVLVGLPVWFCVLLPLLLVWSLLELPFRPCKKNPAQPASFRACDLGPPPQTIVPLNQRPYDLVLYGATGFTGTLAAEYLAKNYGDGSVRWALAGRSKAKLEALVARLQGSHPCPPIQVLIADSADAQQLRSMAVSTRVVVSTVGPYINYGGPLVGACAIEGTSYCDITGETTFVRAMIDQYDDMARASGARIVSHCGNDCIPWDLATLLVSKELRKSGQALVAVHHFDSLRFAPSGGTLETAFTNLSAPNYKPKCGYDPLLKPGGEGKQPVSSGKPGALFRSSLQGRIPKFNSMSRSWVGPFFLAGVNANCIRRSNVLAKYSGESVLVYHEALVYPNFMAGLIDTIHHFVFGTCMLIRPLASLLRRFVLPSPGEGPPMEKLNEGFLLLETVGFGDKGGKATATLYFGGDTGYIGTALMLVESGLVLALQAGKLQVEGGFWTPATCQGEVLLRRLLQTGAMQMKMGA
eukprot:gb/GEZN01005074.1/.p1 GENE.gb/GEZN01005074.1/~~gb/GEZN01005074.1/.p1  ORF type:complete len:521 (-),score=93.29 gb/GEZN01005074.1/:253-1815(-)